MEELFSSVVNFLEHIYYTPGNFLLTCFDGFETLRVVDSDSRDYLRVYLSGFSIITIIGYLMYCVDDAIDTGPKFNLSFGKIKDNKFYLIFYLSILFFILSEPMYCYIKLIFIILIALVFYYSIGYRWREVLLQGEKL